MPPAVRQTTKPAQPWKSPLPTTAATVQGTALDAVDSGDAMRIVRPSSAGHRAQAAGAGGRGATAAMGPMRSGAKPVPAGTNDSSATVDTSPRGARGAATCMADGAPHIVATVSTHANSPGATARAMTLVAGTSDTTIAPIAVGRTPVAAVGDLNLPDRVTDGGTRAAIAVGTARCAHSSPAASRRRECRE